jgi:hypothetical protein
MNIEPMKNAPKASFADAMNTAPVATTSTRFKVALFGADGLLLGYMGENNSGWATLVDDESKAVTIESYPVNGVTYYKNVSSGKYLSVNNQSYAGFYGWAGATGWVLSGKKLVSQFNQQCLSLYSKDNGYLYAWDKYTPLFVEFKG